MSPYISRTARYVWAHRLRVNVLSRTRLRYPQGKCPPQRDHLHGRSHRDLPACFAPRQSPPACSDDMLAYVENRSSGTSGASRHGYHGDRPNATSPIRHICIKTRAIESCDGVKDVLAMKLFNRFGSPWSKAMEESRNDTCITCHQRWLPGALGEHRIGDNGSIGSSLVPAYRRRLRKLSENVIVLLTI